MSFEGKKITAEFPFSDADFSAIASIAQTEFGLHLEHSKKQLVYSRLTKRLRKLQLSSFKSYRDYLDSPDATNEKKELLSALTTNVTQFFRENHHFQILEESVFPILAKRARAKERIRIWSAGCSAGQEPYSLALTLLKVFPNAAEYDVKILATDIDEEILRKAICAKYPLEEMSSIPTDMCAGYLDKVSDGKSFVIRPEVKKLISFGQLNLISSWPISKNFDVIMCRNVAIYFNQETQEMIWNRFANALSSGGYLMIGHSERVSGAALNLLTPGGVTSYCKV